MPVHHSRLTGWIPGGRSPLHGGYYDVRDLFHRVEKALSKNGRWINPPFKIASWRGQYTVLTLQERNRLREELNNYQSRRALPSAKTSAAVAALRLARDRAGPRANGDKGSRAAACKLYIIAISLGADLEPADLAYQKKAWARLSPTKQDSITKKAEKFLGIVKSRALFAGTNHSRFAPSFLQ